MDNGFGADRLAQASLCSPSAAQDVGFERSKRIKAMRGLGSRVRAQYALVGQSRSVRQTLQGGRGGCVKVIRRLAEETIILQLSNRPEAQS